MNLPIHPPIPKIVKVLAVTALRFLQLGYPDVTDGNGRIRTLQLGPFSERTVCGKRKCLLGLREYVLRNLAITQDVF
jgi:hypothetical protein